MYAGKYLNGWFYVYLYFKSIPCPQPVFLCQAEESFVILLPKPFYCLQSTCINLVIPFCFFRSRTGTKTLASIKLFKWLVALTLKSTLLARIIDYCNVFWKLTFIMCSHRKGLRGWSKGILKPLK